MKFLKEVEAISYDDIALRPSYSDLNSRNDADVAVYPYTNPIINSPMIHTSSVNMIKFCMEHKMLTTVHRYFKSGEHQHRHVFEAVGTDCVDVFFSVGKDRKWINTLIDHGVYKFCCDFAHGNSKVCVDTVKYIREKCSDAVIIAGNVASADGYTRLMEAGSDMIRVGIAGGSICSTAKSTAIGIPNVTSIIECAKAKQRCGGQIIADGGIKSSSDIIKAIAVGADMVMCGKMLASTSLAEGPFYMDEIELEYRNGTEVTTDCFIDPLTFKPVIPEFVEYFGMASTKAREYNGTHMTNVSIEGVSGLVEYTGRTSDIINSIENNLRSGMAYCGSRTWLEFKRKVGVQKMSMSGIIEKDTHLHRG
jgi:IMP dehydrogenase